MKTPIDNKLIMGQILEFDMAFPDEKPLSLQEYLTGMSRSVILDVAATFLGFKSYNSKFRDNEELLSNIFNPENRGFANEIYKRILAIEETGNQVIIINPYSSLKLFEYFFTKDEESEKQTHAEFERNLFKSYLVLNSEFSKVQYIASTSTVKLDNELILPMMMFCMDYPIADKMNFDITQIWANQMMKSIYLFQFLESNEKTKYLLSAFLSYFNKQTWQDYLKSFLPLTFPIIQNEKEGHLDIVISPGEGFEDACSFVEKLIIQNNDELDENDFLTIRARPFYKIQEGIYRVIFNLFVLEKIFKGVYFLLRDVNKSLPKKEQVVELKSIYGGEFSEKVLLYKVIESIYPKKHIHFSGEQLTTMKIDGSPDYYLRVGNDILIFESKDFLIRAEKKMSFDFEVYEREFQKVLYYEELPNGKEKPKAVMQLINSIRKLLKNEFKADIDYNYKRVFVYPILITHDNQYDTPGFNELLNYWFQDELLGLKEEGLFVYHIRPLTVVNIDSLIYNQVGLLENIPLHKMLELYAKHKIIYRNAKHLYSKENIMSKMIPFSNFIDNYFKKYKISKMPPVLDYTKHALFNNEIETK